MNFNIALCGIFFTSLIFHFSAVSMMSIDKTYRSLMYGSDYSYCNHTNLCPCRGSIISPVVDIKYVAAIVMLMLTQQPMLVCLISAAIFANSYIRYMSNVYKYKYVFDANVALTMFLCVWIAIYYGLFTNDTFVPYLMLLFSGCVVGQ